MFQYLEELSATEADAIKKTIQDLFRQTCILQVKCDPVSLIQKDNPRYQTCVRHKDFILDYLSVLGCDLIHDPQEHIFRLTGDGLLTERLSLTTTRIMILLKIIYRDKIMGEGLNATVTSFAEIRRYGKDTNLITKKLTAQEWNGAFSVLKLHQMIELPSSIANLEDDTPIYLYNTINLFCSSVDMLELISRYKQLAEENDEESSNIESNDKEGIMEESNLEEDGNPDTDQEEVEPDAAAEEDFYQNVPE